MDQQTALPFKPILFRFNDAMDSRNSSSECLSPVLTPDTSICSHSMGTFSALKTVLTDSATSAPMPSPDVVVSVQEQTSELNKAQIMEEAFRTGNKGYRVFPAKLGWFEDVGLHRGHC